MQVWVTIQWQNSVIGAVSSLPTNVKPMLSCEKKKKEKTKNARIKCATPAKMANYFHLQKTSIYVAFYVTCYLFFCVWYISCNPIDCSVLHCVQSKFQITNQFTNMTSQESKKTTWGNYGQDCLEWSCRRKREWRAVKIINCIISL